MYSSFRQKFFKKNSQSSNSIWDELSKFEKKECSINLSVGTPDFNPPSYVSNALSKTATNDCQVHQYSNHRGLPRLLKALSVLYQPLLYRQLNVEKELLITSGSYAALFTIFMSFLEENDEVIVIEPFFTSYQTLIEMAGGHLVPVSLDFNLTSSSAMNADHVWTLDLNKLRLAFTRKTKILLLNNPHNPTGKVFDKQTLQKVARLCSNHQVLLVCDDPYEFLVYDSVRLYRIASDSTYWPNCIHIGSIGKTFGVTGWKVSWIYGHEEHIERLTKFHKHSLHMTSTPMQLAVAVLLEEAYYCGRFQQQRRLLESKRNRMLEMFNQTCLKPIKCSGGFFLTVDAGDFLSKNKHLFPNQNSPSDRDVMLWLAQNKHILVFPYSAFYSQNAQNVPKHLLRVCFVKSDQTFAKLHQQLTSLSN